MKTVILVLFLFLSMLTFAQPVIYVNYVSHNEDAYPYLNNRNIYMEARNGIVSFATDCQSKGAKWNIGSDYVLLQAIAKYDTGVVIQNTGDKNLLKWLHDDKGVECDPHSHESAYNYSDVAYLHTLLGVTPSSVRSGFIYNSANGHGGTWMDYQNPVQGDSFPAYSWQPEVLWGAASLGHVDDPEYYGMWKPTDTSNFFVHNPSNHLINYGSGCRIVASEKSVDEIMAIIDNLIDNIDNDVAPQSGFYCMSIFFEESNLKEPAFLLKLSELTDSINLRVTDGNMEWKNIEEVVQIWKNSYSAQPFYMSCDMQDISTNLKSDNQVVEVKIYPNPAYDFITIENLNVQVQNLRIFDITGKVCLSSITIKDNKIDVSDLSNGLYFIEINNTKRLKFIKQ